MARFGKWQADSGGLARLGVLGRWYVAVVGYTQVGGFARSLLFKRILARHELHFRDVLDLGCGSGTYALYVAETYPDARITATDHDGECIRTLEATRDRAALTNLMAIRRSHADVRGQNQFDLIYSIDSLQYIREKRDVLVNLYAALRPSGHLLLRIPLPIQKRILPERIFEDHEREEGWRRNQSITPHYDRPLIEKDLLAIGFEIRSLTFTTGFWGRLSFELGHLIGGRSRVGYALVIPVMKLFAYFDTIVMNKRSGDGLLVLARKPEKNV